MAKRIKGKQLDHLTGQGHWVQAPASFSGSVVDVSSAMAGKTPGGNDTKGGVFTTSPINRVELKDAMTGKAIKSSSGNQVYGRIEEDGAGLWEVRTYETDVTVSGTTVTFNNPSGSYDTYTAEVEYLIKN